MKYFSLDIDIQQKEKERDSMYLWNKQVDLVSFMFNFQLVYLEKWSESSKSFQRN